MTDQDSLTGHHSTVNTRQILVNKA